MHHICRLADAINLYAGERSRTIRPGERVDLAEEFLPGVPLASVVDPLWFAPDLPAPTPELEPDPDARPKVARKSNPVIDAA